MPWPLVGREKELDRIGSSLNETPSSGVVLAGDAGVGKTRLALECLERLAGRGYATARVQASQAARAVPLGALHAVLRDTLGETWGEADVLRWASAEIQRLGADRPLAIVVDDAHLLDDMSAALVLQLAMDGGVALIVTIRSGELVPDAVTALWKEGLAERLEIGPLDAGVIEDLLSTVLDGPVEGMTVHRLHELSKGNVLYLSELVRASLESGALRASDGVWRLSQTAAVSGRLVELVQDHLGVLDEPARGLLELLALSDRLGVSTIERHLEAPHLLEALERRGLVAVRSDGKRFEARLAHPIYGEVLRAQMPPLRARRLHRQLADWIQSAGARRREDVLRVGSHLLAAGGDAPADVMLSAAQAARRHWDLDLAVDLADAAAEAGAGFGAGMLLGQLAFLQGRQEEAEERFTSLVAVAEGDDERTELAYGRIDNLIMLGRPDQAMDVIDSTRPTLTDPARMDEMTARVATVLFASGRTRESLTALGPLLGRAKGRAEVEVCTIGSLCMAQAGRFDEAIDLGERGRRAHLELDAPPQTFGTYVGLLGRCEALAHAGRLSEVETLLEDEYRDAVAAGLGDAQAGFAQLFGLVYLLAGRVMTAARYAAEAAALVRERGWNAAVRGSLVYLVQAHALGGNIAAADEAMGELDAIELAGSQMRPSLVLEARGWLEAAKGEITSAIGWLRMAAETAERCGDYAYEASALHAIVRLSADADAAARLGSLVSTVEGPLMTVRVAHANAAVSGDAAALERSSARFDDLGARLYAAEAAAAAAVTMRRDGDPRRAVALERRAAELARRCEGAMTPALRAIESQALLTARELEVAGMAAAGLSNREIAERLTISVRTVETQLQRVYEKLGVRGRMELPEALEL